jgi:hypothetical protein
VKYKKYKNKSKEKEAGKKGGGNSGIAQECFKTSE